MSLVLVIGAVTAFAQPTIDFQNGGDGALNVFSGRLRSPNLVNEIYQNQSPTRMRHTAGTYNVELDLGSIFRSATPIFVPFNGFVTGNTLVLTATGAGVAGERGQFGGLDCTLTGIGGTVRMNLANITPIIDPTTGLGHNVSLSEVSATDAQTSLNLFVNFDNLFPAVVTIDRITTRGTGGFAPVPEPASMAVLGLGLAAFRRRRTARKA